MCQAVMQTIIVYFLEKEKINKTYSSMFKYPDVFQWWENLSNKETMVTRSEMRSDS